MIILPAIDLKGGTMVRLYKGDFSTAHQVAEDPLATAKDFYDAGARWIHMVDLDGARDGTRGNSAIVEQVARQSGLQVELGGGIRSMADLEVVFAMGVTRAVIGSAAVSHPEFVRRALERYGPDRVAVGIDARNGQVKTAGWEQDSGRDYLEFAADMVEIGVKKIIFTDIEMDGTLAGPNTEQLTQLTEAVSCDIIASGGISGNGDIRTLAAMGVYGAIIGKAYYAGAIDLAQAVRDGGAQC